MQIADMGQTADERQKIGECKRDLAAKVAEIAREDNAPVLVAALGELTAELSYTIAGPHLTVVMFCELAKQISIECEAMLIAERDR
jgi:hypothetical protein